MKSKYKPGLVNGDIVLELEKKINKMEKYLSAMKLNICQGDCIDEIYGQCKEFDKCRQYNKPLGDK